MLYTKTELGQSAMHSRSVPLSPRQRAAFIMFDGKRDSAAVLQSMSVMGVTSEDIDHLVALNLLAPADLQRAAPPQAQAVAVAPVTSSNVVDGRPTLSAQAHYNMAYPIATRLTAALGLRGFMLNLAVEAAGDIDKLKELAPKIKDAVGAEKFQPLDDALNF